MVEKRKAYTQKVKKAVEETASKTVKVTATIVKIVFIVIIVYTIIISVWLFLNTDRQQFFTNVATISVGGFWAFFLGYFGWRMGQTIELYFHNLKKKK
jgi:Trk-type K+ transport system membrane component